MRLNPNALANLEPEIADQITSRRDALRRIGGTLAATAGASVAFTAAAREAFAQTGGPPEQVVEVLQFALTLERLEAAYYSMGLEEDGLIPGDVRVVFETIGGHEDEHVAFLEEALGDSAGEAPELDFTAGGMFDPFGSYETFLLLAQAFEDTGQRAYRGQAPNLVEAPEVLTQALTIHSVEARHAALVRSLRDLQGWIPQDQPGVPAAVAPVYAGMDLTEKYGVDLTELSGAENDRITEAFDEPLTMEEVLAIAGPFIVS
jgi:rubrerythrin